MSNPKVLPYVMYQDSAVKNFSLTDFPQALVRAYGSQCGGCVSTKSDVMLTFGSEIAVLDGNNQPTQIEQLRHVDVFLNRKQAIKLLEELKKALNEPAE